MRLALALLLLAAGAARAEDKADFKDMVLGIGYTGSLLYLNAEMIGEGHWPLALAGTACLATSIVRVSTQSRDKALKDSLAKAAFLGALGIYASYPVYSMFRGQAERDEARVYGGLAGVACLVLPLMLSGMKGPKPGPSPFNKVSDQPISLAPLPGGAMLALRGAF